MSSTSENGGSFTLDSENNEAKRRRALLNRCAEYRARLKLRSPQEIAGLAAMSLTENIKGKIILQGGHMHEIYSICWPDLKVTDGAGQPADLSKELLWLHYLDRADGHTLAGRWVNLSEIGGLFYQQAFQGYSGDELAAAWGGDIEGFRQKCIELEGWAVKGLGDLAFEWRVLPRLPLCICYRKPSADTPSWASVLFDAAANHYVAADVAAIAGKELVELLKP